MAGGCAKVRPCRSLGRRAGGSGGAGRRHWTCVSGGSAGVATPSQPASRLFAVFSLLPAPPPTHPLPTPPYPFYSPPELARRVRLHASDHLLPHSLRPHRQLAHPRPWAHHLLHLLQQRELRFLGLHLVLLPLRISAPHLPPPLALLLAPSAPPPARAREPSTSVHARFPGLPVPGLGLDSTAAKQTQVASSGGGRFW